MIRASDGVHLWSDTYDRKLENIFDLQDEIATKVLAQLKLKLLGTTSPYHSRSQEVHKLLLQGRYFYINSESFKALDFYQQAVRIDSTDAAVWTSLAQVHALIGNTNFTEFNNRFIQVKYCAKKALALDDKFSDAHRVLGLAYYFYDFDWESARREFQTAIQLDPNNSDAYRNLGSLEMSIGEMSNSMDHFKKSIDLNPLSYLILSNLSTHYIIKGDYRKAEQLAKDAAALNASRGNVELVYLYIISEQPDLAQKQMTELPSTVSDSEKSEMMAMIEYTRGHKAEALQMLKHTLDREESGSFFIGEAFAFMGESDEAFKWLNAGYNEKYGMAQLKRSPYLSKLRKDKRYIELLKKMNLPID